MTTAESEIVELPQLAGQWTRIRGRLQAEVGEVEYRTWLRQMTLTGLDGDEITVSLPTRFLRDWVSTRYGDRLRAMWQLENPAIRRVDIRVGDALVLCALLGRQIGLDACSHRLSATTHGCDASQPPLKPARCNPART